MTARAMMTAAIAVAGVMMVVGVATARAPAPTTIVDMDVSCGQDPDPETCIYHGFIESPSAKCIANRKVKMFALFNSAPPQLVDTARTSGRGAFAGRGETGDVSAARAVVTRKKVGKKVCKADVYEGA